jgi:hypothetical protein
MKSKIDLNTIKRGSLSLAVALFLTACGGGGTSAGETPPVTPSPEDTNNAPTLSITTKSSSVFEGMSVELNATATDSDNDRLTYSWTQKSGETVSLINATTAKPSFIAPDVSKDSNVSFELEVSDGKVTTGTKAMVSVNVIDVPKVSKYHEVIPKSTAVTAKNALVTLSYNYNKKPISKITSGLVLNVYWDSSKLEYSKVEVLFNKDYIGVSSIKNDSENSDSDTSTDKYMSISWVNLANGNWEMPSTLPTALFLLEMKTKASQTGNTTLNIRTNVASPGLEFYSQSVLVDLGR